MDKIIKRMIIQLNKKCKLEQIFCEHGQANDCGDCIIDFFSDDELFNSDNALKDKLPEKYKGEIL